MRPRASARGFPRHLTGHQHTPRAVRTHAHHLVCGALIIMGAMGLFATQAFAAIGGYGLAATGILYMFILAASATGSGRSPNPTARWAPDRGGGGDDTAHRPSAAGGLEHLGPAGPTGDYPASSNGCARASCHGNRHLLVATLALRRYSFAFLALPAALCLWFLSMDLAPLLFGREDGSISGGMSRWSSGSS